MVGGERRMGREMKRNAVIYFEAKKERKKGSVKEKVNSMRIRKQRRVAISRWKISLWSRRGKAEISLTLPLKVEKHLTLATWLLVRHLKLSRRRKYRVREVTSKYALTTQF